MNKAVKGLSALLVAVFFGGVALFSYHPYTMPPLSLIVYMSSEESPALLQWSSTQAMYAFHPRKDEVETLNAEAGVRYAALYPDPQTAEQLLSHFLDSGVKINSIDRATGTGVTALHSAVLDQNAHAVRLLLEHGADPAKTDLQGRTSLDFARTVAEKQPGGEVQDIILILEAATR